MTGSDLVLDTNVVIDYFKRSSRVVAVINQAERIYLPFTVVGELYFGVYRSSNPMAKKQEVETFLPTVKILTIDLVTADVYGVVKASLVNKGKPIPHNDV